MSASVSAGTRLGPLQQLQTLRSVFRLGRGASLVRTGSGTAALNERTGDPAAGSCTCVHTRPHGRAGTPSVRSGGHVGGCVPWAERPGRASEWPGVRAICGRLGRGQAVEWTGRRAVPSLNVTVSRPGQQSCPMTLRPASAVPPLQCSRCCDRQLRVAGSGPSAHLCLRRSGSAAGRRGRLPHPAGLLALASHIPGKDERGMTARRRVLISRRIRAARSVRSAPTRC